MKDFAHHLQAPDGCPEEDLVGGHGVKKLTPFRSALVVPPLSRDAK